MYKHTVYPELLQFNTFAIFADSLVHFSTTRLGGISKGNYTSFNLGLLVEDNIKDVSENRKKLAAVIGVGTDKLFFPYQVHDDKIRIIDDSFIYKTKEEQEKLLYGVDAIITNLKNVCIGVSTADCVPVIVYDPVKNVLAAIHAGWRGTVAKIVVKTIKEMMNKYGCSPQDMMAGIAPSISQKHFEVGDEVVQAFQEAGFPMDKIGMGNPVTGKTHLNLQLANKWLMENSGILHSNIEISEYCTYSCEELFFSARRQSIRCGRMFTGGMLL